MTRINYSDNIRARGRALYLQTNNLEEERKIISTLFESGRVLGKEERGYNDNLTSEKLRDRIKKLHMGNVTTIELLYEISVGERAECDRARLNQLGLGFMKWNLLEEAIGAFRRALQCDSHDRDSWFRLGVANLQNKDYVKAMQAFRRALKIDPGNENIRFYVTLCLIEILVNGVPNSTFSVDNDFINKVGRHLNRMAALSSRFRKAELEKALKKFNRGEYVETLTILRSIAHERQNPDFDKRR